MSFPILSSILLCPIAGLFLILLTPRKYENIVRTLAFLSALGTVIFCMKFGMNDWLTALWIRRRDHCGRRAATYTWFLLGSGFIKVFLVSGVAFPLLWLVWNAFEQSSMGVLFRRFSCWFWDRWCF